MIDEKLLIDTIEMECKRLEQTAYETDYGAGLLTAYMSVLRFIENPKYLKTYNVILKGRLRND